MRIPALAGLAALAVAIGAVLLLAGRDSTGEATEPRTTPLAEAAGLASRPDLRPPEVLVERAPADPGDRLIFTSPRMENFQRDAATHQHGALAFDQRGRVRWFRPGPDGEPITDVRVQRYRGEPVLTFWQGAASELGIGRGKGIILDSSYREIADIKAGNGETSDLHEVLLTDRGTALLTIFSRTRGDLSALGGKADAVVTQGIVQEVDVETGDVVFEWESIDHVEPSEGVVPLPEDPDDSYDYFHINSIEEDADGDLLVSARNTSAVYKVDRETGEVVWRLGGKRSDFELGPGVAFGLQHDARWIADDVVQIFDNAPEAGEGEEQLASSGKRIRLDEERMRATLVQRFDHPAGEWAESQGSVQALDDGGALVGWGSLGSFSRFDADGDLEFNAHLPTEYDAYRAYLEEWVGRPAVPPAVDAARERGQVTVSASWNGSTEVQAWQVLAGPSPDDLEPVGEPAEWQGLETTIVRGTEEPYVAVAALDGAGRELARSPAVQP